MARRRNARSTSSSSAWSSEDEEDQSEQQQSGDNTSTDEDHESWSLGKRSGAAKNLRRLRRIFLNRPQKLPSRSPPKPKAKSVVQLERRRRTRAQGSDDSDNPRRPARESSWERETSELGNTRRRSIDQLEERRPMRLAIDHHIHSLCDHVKRLSVQRDSTTNQVHSMLEQAVEELEFLRKQEERSLQILIKQIHESFALRLEIFEQQYLSKVAEIQQEMHTAIQREKENCDATILTAAKKLQEQTQLALLKELPTRQTCTSRPGSPQRAMSQSTTTTQSSYLHRPVTDSARKADANREPKPPQLSPVSKQKAKLRALEAKLATFSKEAIDRVDNQKKLMRKASIAWSVTENHASERATSKPPASVASRESRAGGSSWQPTPLSPLRKHESFWRNGISLEASRAEGSGPSDADPGSRPKRPSSILTSRFLLPEEEQELRSLRNSIGLAKDWMETHNAR